MASAADMRSLALFVALTAPLSRGIAFRSPAPGCTDSAFATHFDFHDTPWLNLHNFLFKEAKLRRGIADDGLGARGNLTEDTAGARPLDPQEHAGWNDAVEYYASVIIRDDMGLDSVVARINDRLANAAPDEQLVDADLPSPLRRVLLQAMPVYRVVWWPVHERRNEQWIGRMRAQLAHTEPCLAPRLAQLLEGSWPSEPIRVDATVYASWFGAYSTLHPLHSTISTTARGSQDTHGLEVLLHEAGHGMLGTIDSTLTAQARRQRRALPPELSHLVLFYTAGAIMTELVPEYTPYAEAFGIWDQNATARRYQAILQREWQPYIDGHRSLSEAIAGIVHRLPSSS